MKFFLILIGSVIAVFMGMGTIYFWGMGQIHPKYEHVFFTPKTPWIALPYSQEQELQKISDAIVWMDVYRNSQSTFVVDSKDSNSSLADLLKKWSGRGIILNINSNVEDIDRQLSEFLPSYIKNSAILLQSEYDIILRATKESFADIPYGSSQSDRMRFSVFAGMAPWPGGLISATPFHGDVYISALKWKSISLVNKVVVDEIHRRQKYVLIGPLKNEDELRQAQSLDADGYYIQNMQLLKSLTATH